MTTVRAFAVDVPVTIDRDAARDAAREELSKPIYDEAQPSLLVRAVRWVLEHLQDILDRIGNAAPGGWFGVLIMLAIGAVAAYVILLGAGPVRGRMAAKEPIFDEGRRSSGDYRRSADEARRRGDWAVAARERFRAIVRTLEERGLLDDRPGRTADEAAAVGGNALPSLHAGLAAGSQIFDEIVYGERRATQHHDEELRILDEAVRDTRPTVVTP